MSGGLGWIVGGALAAAFGYAAYRTWGSGAAGDYDETGGASWYGPGLEGNLTASGDPFDPTALTAAHKSLPFGTKVEVTDLDTGATVVVEVNDRGPYVQGRIIDLTEAAADALGIRAAGTANVGLRLL